mmetsp:Transcript_7939/g.22125  ORF Transcript_7939/g.22125 Transcript_7939/m.22125 type:complete len:218 (+) Transcript_7939:1135-1788(+)
MDDRGLLRRGGIVEGEEAHLHGVEGQTKPRGGLGQAGTDGGPRTSHYRYDPLVGAIVARSGKVVGGVGGRLGCPPRTCSLGDVLLLGRLLLLGLAPSTVGKRRVPLQKVLGAIVGGTNTGNGGEGRRGRWDQGRQGRGGGRGRTAAEGRARQMMPVPPTGTAGAGLLLRPSAMAVVPLVVGILVIVAVGVEEEVAGVGDGQPTAGMAGLVRRRRRWL